MYQSDMIILSFTNNAPTWRQDKKSTPVILYAGHNSGEDYLYELTEYFQDKKFGVINISKSGTTTETALACYFCILLKIFMTGSRDFA